MRVQVGDISGVAHRVYIAGRFKFETWKASPDASPMLMIYPRPRTDDGPLRAVQVTVWRRKFEFRW